MTTHPAVADICVVGVPHPEWGEAVIALVRPRKDNMQLNSAELINFCRDKLNRISTPKHIIFVDDDFPRTTNFKVLKKEVREIAIKKGLPWEAVTK